MSCYHPSRHSITKKQYSSDPNYRVNKQIWKKASSVETQTGKPTLCIMHSASTAFSIIEWRVHLKGQGISIHHKKNRQRLQKHIINSSLLFQNSFTVFCFSGILQRNTDILLQSNIKRDVKEILDVFSCVQEKRIDPKKTNKTGKLSTTRP